MRISDTQFSQMMLQSLQSNNAGLGKVMQQMSTGKELTKLSDSPIDSINLLSLSREGSAIEQYQENISSLKTTLSSQEVYLDAASESLKSMRELVLWGANDTLTQDDRVGIVNEMRSLRDSLQSTFNAQNEQGHYLFSGTQTDEPSVMKTPMGYQVGGNSDKRSVSVAKGVNMDANVTSQEMLNLGGDNVFNQIDRVIAEFSQPTVYFDQEVTNSLAYIDATMGRVLSEITTLGGRHNNVDLLDTSHGDNKLFVDKVTGDIEALDYGKASVKLADYMSALQSTQSSYLKINDLSLFDRL